jgi:RNase adapter protein RapZ
MSDVSRPARVPLLVVTGMSGAGRSTALKALEDMGYEAVDNLPLSLLPNLVRAEHATPLAVGLDVRTRDFAVPALVESLDKVVAEQDRALEIVFLDCDDELLERRYTETRRRHPLAQDRPVADGITLERQRLWPLRGRADLVIDSSSLAPGDLKRILLGHYALGGEAAGMFIYILSFAYRHGLPRNADLVFDVRFLRNPHYVDALRRKTGRDEAVGAYIEEDPEFHNLYGALRHWVEEALPAFEREGKTYLTVAIGCTGGRHRSVYCAERLARWLKEAGRRVEIAHRDIDRAEPGLGGFDAGPRTQAMKDIA